jgi:hypothetical protein
MHKVSVEVGHMQVFLKRLEVSYAGRAWFVLIVALILLMCSSSILAQPPLPEKMNAAGWQVDFAEAALAPYKTIFLFHHASSATCRKDGSCTARQAEFAVPIAVAIPVGGK